MTPTSTLTILGRSLRASLRRWPVWLSLYGVSLLIVLPVVLALRSTLASVFADSPAAQPMLGGFDHATYDDFMLANRSAIQFFTRTVGPFMFLSILVHGVFGAGIVAAMSGVGSVEEFFRATGRFLGRSIRLVLYALMLGAIVMGLWTFGIAAVWSAMTAGDAVESRYLTAAIVVAVLFLLPVAIISLATEYGRVFVVREDRRKVLVSLFEGFRFVFLHPIRMILQHGVIFLTMIAFVALYWLIDAEIGMTSAIGIMIMLIVQQLSVFLRVGLRVWQTSSAVALVDVLTPEVPLAAEAAPAVVPATAAPATEIIQSAPLPVEHPEKAPVRRKAPAVRRPAKRPVRRPRSR